MYTQVGFSAGGSIVVTRLYTFVWVGHTVCYIRTQIELPVHVHRL